MKKILLVIAMLIIAAPVLATVSVTATDKGSGVAEIRYNCSAAEKVRAFALDITVDNGLVISNIRDFNTGESKKPGGGYGIFPAKFADYINVNPPGPNWADTRYTPVARTTDPNTKSGLGTGAITVELGTLYVDPNSPGTSGLLFRLDVNGNGAADGNLSIALNGVRGGIVLEDANLAPSPVLTGTKMASLITLPPPCINIPAILGDNMTDANSAIRAALLTGTIAITYECNGTYGTGIVCRQDTGCVAASTTINYVVSTGPCCTTILNEVGVLKATAEAAWTGQGFTLGVATQVVSCPAGNIVSQDTTGCVTLPHTVNYSYGIQATEPNIVNKTMPDANSTLAAAGIPAPYTITYEPNGLKTALTVDRQSPPPGTATCSASYVVDTNCLYVGRVFSGTGITTLTVTQTMIDKWNYLGMPNCWCCPSQKRGNGIYTGSSACKVDAADLGAVKNASVWMKQYNQAGYLPCLDFNLSGKIDAADLGILKNASNWMQTVGCGPPCQ
ncbi:MAG: PASTA domain-containing protein [Sedimentisphaerales bacterium]|jgi:hypothetical protein